MKIQALSASSVGTKISMIPLSDESKTGEELHDDRSKSTNAMSVIYFDIGCISDEIPTQAELLKYATIGHSRLTKQYPHDLDKQAFPEITLKICGTNGEM